MCFNIAKCKVTHVGARNVGLNYRMWDCILESNDVEKDLRVRVDKQLTVSSLCCAGAKRLIGSLDV